MALAVMDLFPASAPIHAVVALRLAGLGIAAALGWLLGSALAPWVWGMFTRAMAWSLQHLASFSLRDLIAGVTGLMVGLVLAFLIGYLLSGIPVIGPYLRIAAALVFGYLGFQVAMQRREDLVRSLPHLGELPQSGDRDRGGRERGVPKILDTSVIIDGRIADIVKTGFLEGPLLVPRFVLSELQRIADSPDPLRRNRGRRGLDVLNKLQREFQAVRVVESSDGGGDVDSRLVRLAKSLRGWIVTNDFNLNKVAELEGIRVLNINELAGALRPVVLPGEELSVHIIKEGKEAGQGVGYLDDGTMIVVEGGKRYIGETPELVVTSVLQTVAGRMIFTRPKDARDQREGAAR
ncbi:MAG: TRAM domain-containing protein [Armatimonadetes bacterium]|nr:TRAM domain-containing protein [Armatimonadota bacterium]